MSFVVSQAGMLLAGRNVVSPYQRQPFAEGNLDDRRARGLPLHVERHDGNSDGDV